MKTRSGEFTQSFTYLGAEDKILLAKSGDNKLQLQVDGQGIDEHLAEIKRDGIKTFVSDHLGTVINSEVTDQYKTTGAFGEILQTAPVMGATTNPVIYGFTGRQYEPETGLYYYRNRMFDPVSGRFLTKDPLGIQGGDVNLYRYGGNNTFLYTDPYGLQYGPDPDFYDDRRDEGELMIIWTEIYLNSLHEKKNIEYNSAASEAYSADAAQNVQQYFKSACP